MLFLLNFFINCQQTIQISLHNFSSLVQLQINLLSLSFYKDNALRDVLSASYNNTMVFMVLNLNSIIINLISWIMQTIKEEELEQMLRSQQHQELSSEEETQQQEIFRKSQYRKPIKNSYSDDGEESDSSIQPAKIGTTPLPPKPSKTKSVLQQAQQEMRWTKQDQSEMELLSKLQGNGMKDKKIRELANKYKSLNISYQKQRTIRKQLENQLNSSMKANMQVKKVQEQGRSSLEKTGGSKNQKEKCSNCAEQDKKIMELRLKHQNVKAEINKAHRLIARQMGENFDIDKALTEQNSWKGRQQKIQKLKGRVKELQEKLAQNGVNVSHMSGFTQMTGGNATKNNSFSATQRTSTLADNKRKELQNLKVQVQALRSQNDLLQSKVKSLSSRKLNLESEIKQLKADYQKKKQIFVQKSANDDRFITLLKQENDKLKKDERVVTKIVYKQSKDNSQQIQIYKKQIDSLKRKVKELQKSSVELQNQKKQQKVVKAVNEVREISSDRRKQLQQEYLKSNKYLKKMSTEDEEQIYKAWKQSKNKI